MPAGSLLEAAGACGLQNTPPGSAALGLDARVEALTPADIEHALDAERSLLQVWSLRQAPLLVPTADLPVFTTGLLPTDEEGLRWFLQGAAPVLDDTGMSATEMVSRGTEALRDALDGQVLTKRELGAEMATRLPEKLRPWFEPETFSNFTAIFARPISLAGLFAFTPRSGNQASFVRTDQWLPAPPPAAEPNVARAELLRRYLHCLGPSTAEDFAAWTGLSPADSQRSWALIEDELVEIEAGGVRSWLLQEDRARLEAPPAADGVRLLPPYDQYLNLRDRATVIPDRSLQAHVWGKSGNPGVVLVDGQAVATWRQQKKGRRLMVTVEPFATLSPTDRDAVHVAAGRIGPYRDVTTVSVAWDG